MTTTAADGVSGWVARSLLFAAVLALGGCIVKAKVGSGPGNGACTSTAACGGAQYCSGGTCVPKLPVGACSDAPDHQASDVCTSGVCFGGACCTAACTESDPLCRAASCDTATGACQYPAGSVACGPAESCANGSYTAASSCDGHGGCALAPPKACESLACANGGKVCLQSCSDDSACPSGQYCAWSQCTPRQGAGGTCGQTNTSSANSACTSGICLGTYCCTATCLTVDSQCGATTCDGNGACVYPPQYKSCGTLQSCVGETYTPPWVCDGQGTCTASPPISCEPFVCNPLQPQACYAACSAGGGECSVDAFCSDARCDFKKAAGKPCGTTTTSDADSACISELCSVNCCVADCPPDPLTNNCKGVCDTAGACSAVTCPNNFGCSGTSTCATHCKTGAECAATAFCDAVSGGCCGHYQSGDTIYVDSVNGLDTNPCCGDTPLTACQTLTHAMALVAASATSGVVLEASNGDGSNGWSGPETWPVHLGWGITLHAPGTNFVNTKKVTDVFDVYAYDLTDTGMVTIQGGTDPQLSDSLSIGFNPQLANPPTSDSAAAYHHAGVAVNDAMTGKTALPMRLSGVWMAANDLSGQATGLKVGAGASVILGPNPVAVGAGWNLGHFDGNCPLCSDRGISCSGSGASMQDDPTSVDPVLTIDGMNGYFLDVEDGCSVTLTQGPRLGYQYYVPSSGYYSTTACATSANYPGAVVVGGGSTLNFGSVAMPGTIKCAAYYGIDMESSNTTGSPTVNLLGATIDLNQDIFVYDNGYLQQSGAACAGAYVTEGTLTASNTTFTHELTGVYVGGNAVSVDLSGGGAGGNTFVCNNSTWGWAGLCGSGIAPSTGGDIVNLTDGLAVNAENGTWDNWDGTANATQLWSCTDTSYQDCTCSGANCPGSGSQVLPADADGVYLSSSTATTPIDSTAGTQSAATTCQ